MMQPSLTYPVAGSKLSDTRLARQNPVRIREVQLVERSRLAGGEAAP